LTWTRLDDNWTRDRVIRRLNHQTRWHYLCMIQECSGGKIYDGVLSLGDALRCSDADDPRVALDALIDAELVEVVDGGENVRVVHIDQHVPSADLLARMASDKARSARYRKHKAGDHSDCLPEKCPTASRDGERDMSRDARDGDGDRTGLAVTGSTGADRYDEQVEAERRIAAAGDAA
jgi:hypothetical protein